ncbi:MAG: M23 family metallopeptidase [Bacteroidia bacterium]|nr:M23 family metallopeptidase [Bacteroidia bacterium]
MLIGLFYIFVPLLLIGIIAFQKQPNFWTWILTIISFGLVISYMWGTTRWEIISIYFRPIVPILYLIACIVGYKRTTKQKNQTKKLALILNIAVHAVLIVFFSGLNWFTYSGYITPENTVDLVSPFQEGKQIVLHGGSSPFINGHYHVKPQNHALDIVGLNNLGMRASSFGGGADLNNYVIYGEPIYSPCNGTILKTVDQFDDLTPPNTDKINLAGNYILIDCDGVELLLAHLKKGSIKVKPGDTVTTNTLLGQVGNTGNTSEPHLHIHMEKGGEANTILNGEGIPFTINQKFLVRGDRIKRQ